MNRDTTGTRPARTAQTARVKGLTRVTGTRGEGRCRKPESRRREILAAARQVFAAKGFQRATTREIAQAAQASEGTIFNYFASKDDILLGLVQDCLITTILPKMTIPEGGDDVTILEGFIANRLAHFQEFGDVIAILLGEAMFRPAFGRQFVDRMLSTVYAILTGFIDRGIRAGRFVKADPKVLARALLGQILGTGFLWPYVFREKGLPPAEVLAPLLARLFLDGVRRPASAKRRKGGAP